MLKTHSAHLGLFVEDGSSSKATFSNSGSKAPLPFQPSDPPEYCQLAVQAASTTSL